MRTHKHHHSNCNNSRRLQQFWLWLSCCLTAAIIFSACARKDYGAFQQDRSSREQQQLYKDLHAPLHSSHTLLKKLLPRAQASTMLFELRQSGARMVERAIRQEDLWNERLAVFFLTPRVRSDGYDLFYFDPRAMRIQQIPATSDSNEPVHAIVRSCPVRRKPTFTQNELDVFYYSFRLDEDSGLRFHRHRRLSAHPGNNIMPVMLPDYHMVVYTSVDSEGRKRIMQVPLFAEDAADTEARLLISDPAVESTHPRILSDGSLGIIANPEGYFRAYEFDLRKRSYRPTSKRAAGADHGDLVLSSLNGKDTPLLFRVPERLDLQTLLGLVEAHNTSVNRYRALLAAALIQARRSKLHVLPNMEFGVYYTPLGTIASGSSIASGDFLTEGISRGLLGLVQNLLAIPKHLALSEAQVVRAQIAHGTLLDEINQRQAEVADLYFQAQLFQQLLEIDKTLLDIVKQQEQRQQHRKHHGTAISVEVMGLETSVIAVEKRLADHQRRYDLLMDEIKSLCALPRHKQIELDTEIYLFEKDRIETYTELKQMAILNNPGIQAARLQLDKAFFEAKTYNRLDPSLTTGISYGRSHEDFGEFIDEFVTVSVNASIPVGSIKDYSLKRSYWQEMHSALQLGQEQQTQKTLRLLKHNLHAFYGSRDQFQVQQQHLAHALEQIRLARIFKRYPLAQTAYRQGSKDLPEARRLYYQALTETLRQHASLAQYYTRVWRDMGLVRELPDRLQPIRREALNKKRFSTWVWNAQELLTKRTAIDSFVSAARRNDVRKAYVYLEADDQVLSDPLLSERLTMLINRCARYDINIWALVGNKNDGPRGIAQSQLHNSARHIEQYNKRFKALEPRLAGMKIHVPQAGSTDIADQKQYRRVLEQTRALLPRDLPLWIDVPLNAFTEENARHIRDVLHLVDGVTVFNPNGENQEILMQANALFELSPAMMEIAIQHDPRADGDALNNIIKTLHKNQLDKKNFAGIALLDWSQILRQEESEAEEEE